MLPFYGVGPISDAIGFTGFVVVGAAVFAVRIWGGRFLRDREHRADRRAGTSEEASRAMASALQKLHRFNRMPVVGVASGGTHPDLVHRLEELGVRPDFEVPASPAKWRGIIGSIGAVAVAAVLVFGVQVGAERGLSESGTESPPSSALLTIRGARAGELGQLGVEAARGGDPRRAYPLLELCASRDRRRVVCDAWAASVAADLGDCNRATEHAERLLDGHRAESGRHDASNFRTAREVLRNCERGG